MNLLPAEAFVGKLDTNASSLPQVPPKAQPAPPSSVASAGTSAPQALVPVLTKTWAKPPLEQMLNIFDFEAIAQNVMKKEGWDYYSSGADDEITLRENHAAFQVRSLALLACTLRVAHGLLNSASGYGPACSSTSPPLTRAARHAPTPPVPRCSVTTLLLILPALSCLGQYQACRSTSRQRRSESLRTLRVRLCLPVLLPHRASSRCAPRSPHARSMR